MLQTRTARWVVLTAFACVAVLTAAWFLLVSPRRAEAADIRDRTDAAASQNDSLEVTVAQLKAQFATLATNKKELAQILQQLPPGAGTPELVRSLDSMATESGVLLRSVTPGAASYLPDAATGAGAAGAAGTTGATGATGTTAVAGAGAGTPDTGSAGSTAGSAMKVVSIPLVVVVHGDYFQTVVYLKKLQTQMPRAFLVNSLQVATSQATGPGASASGIDLTITGKVFALLGVDSSADGTGAPGTAAAGSSDPGTTGSRGAANGTGSTGSTGTGSAGTTGGSTNALGGRFPAGTSATRLAEDS